MDNYRDFAIEVAKDAGKIVMDHCGKIRQLEWKLKTNFKTAVDDEIDQFIRSKIAKAFPNHSIYSEELDATENISEYSWVIDPLDGTLPYANGLSGHFGVSIGLVNDREPILGVFYAPARSEVYVAEKGKGAFLNDQKLEIQPIESLNHALIGLDYGKHDRAEILKLQEKLLGPDGVTYTFAYGSAATALCLVAAGRLHGYLALKLEPWDMAAAVVIIREAGGKVTNIEGEDWQFGNESILAADPETHKKMLEILHI